MFAIEFFRRAVLAQSFGELMPPVIAAGAHINRRFDARAHAGMHDDVLYRGTIGQRFIYRRLQRHLLAAP